MTSLRNLIVGCIAVGALVSAAPAEAGHRHRQACCEPVVVCAPPAPVKVSWCVKDPVTCCTYQVSACVPACCAGQTPVLASCKRGFLGRKILTYKFACCGKCVDVVVTKHGRTIVRD